MYIVKVILFDNNYTILFLSTCFACNRIDVLSDLYENHHGGWWFGKLFFELGIFKVSHRFDACEIKEVMCFFVMLEDCRIGRGVSHVQRSNIVENLLKSVGGLWSSFRTKTGVKIL
jgi:hypothetical protein